MDENFEMKFRAHDTFFIRKGWLSKGLRNVVRDPDVFKGTYDNAMDVLGIGANMVKALRYWMQAVGLTDENSNKKRSQFLTDLGKLVKENDPYIEEIGTLLLLHYELVKNRSEATAWYFFFNEFYLSEFSKEDFTTQLNSYVRLNGQIVSLRSLEDDYNCIINTYVPRIKSNPQKVQPENNIDCPFGDLGLIDIVNKHDKTYRKTSPKVDTFPPLILLAVVLDEAKDSKEIKLSSLRDDRLNVGKVFNLDIITLMTILYKLELMGYIKIVRTAGLDVIEILKGNNFLGCVEAYYDSIK